MSATRTICPSIVLGAVLGIGADRHAALPFRVLRDAVAHLPRQVQPRAVVLEDVDDAQALLVVVEAAGHRARR